MWVSVTGLSVEVSTWGDRLNGRLDRATLITSGARSGRSASGYRGPVTLKGFADRRVVQLVTAPHKPPGPIHLASTVVAVLVLVCLHRGWWPSPFGEMRRMDPLLAGALSLLTLATVGLLWAIRTLYVVGDDRRWSWWILAAPAVVAVAVAASLVLPPPSFLETSAGFESVARELVDGPGTTRADIEIGRFDISHARATPTGEVYFTDAGGIGITTSTGWVYSPNGPPAGYDDFTATHLGGPWYEFTSAWRD